MNIGQLRQRIGINLGDRHDHDDAGHAGPAQHEPAAAGSDSGQDGRVDAVPDDLHHGEIRRRAGDLLDDQQHPVGYPAICHHAVDGGRG